MLETKLYILLYSLLVVYPIHWPNLVPGQSLPVGRLGAQHQAQWKYYKQGAYDYKLRRWKG